MADTPDPAWYDAVGIFKKKAAEFETNYQGLLNQRAFVEAHPQLLPQWRKLVADGASTRAKVQAINKGIDAVQAGIENIASNVADSALAITDKLSTWWGDVKSAVGLSGLGFLPALVSIAAIAAVVALITKWSLDALRFKQSMDEVRRLESQGVAPAQAAAIVSKTAAAAGVSSGGLEFLGFKVSPWLVAGAAAVVLLPPVMHAINGSRRRA